MIVIDKSRRSSRALTFALLLTALASSLAPHLAYGQPRRAQRRAQSSCAAFFKDEIKTTKKKIDVDSLTKSGPARSVARELLAFADRHQLPFKLVEVGPSNRRTKRVMVAIDSTNAELVADYLRTFNLDQPAGNGASGTFAIELEREFPGQYVFGTVRTGSQAGSREGAWRYGRDQEAPADWWARPEYSNHTEADGSPSVITAFGHLIGLDPAQRDNVKFYLENPAERGPCKSGNCLAWATGIELGKTSKEGTDESRLPLFNELGVSRTIAHFEIARRLMHAANSKHIATVAFVRGVEGLRQFATRDDVLPPEPQMPYPSIIPGLVYPENSPVMRAMNAIPDGAKVFVPIAAGASPEGIEALVQRTASMAKGVTVDMLVNGISESTLRKGLTTTDGKFRVRALFLGSNMRKLNKQGLLEVIPGYLSDFPRWTADPERPEFHYDVMLVRVAPPDAQGRYSLGPNNDMILSILRNRPGIKIIAEVNHNVPRTLGENFLTREQISETFESRTELAGPPQVGMTEVESAIGENLARLVPSGATLQVGIGNIFSGFADALRRQGRAGIQIHTEMLGDAQMDMLDSGTAVAAKAGFAYLAPTRYKALEQNDKIRFVETEYVNDPGRVAQLPSFRAVNTALQVSLRGDSNATHVEDSRISSPGGQVEFMSGSARAKDGKGFAIIAIRSLGQRGQVSSIVLNTYQGVITTPHESVTHVVTEYGIADLRSASESERAARLIAIAHPHFRPQLIADAVKAGLLTKTRAATIPSGVTAPP